MAVDGALLQSGEHLGPAHGLGRSAVSGVEVHEEVAAGDADLEAGEVLRLLDGVLAVGDELEAVVDGAEVGDALGAEQLGHVLAAGAEKGVLSSLVVGEQPGHGADHGLGGDAGDDGGGVDVDIRAAAGEQLDGAGHVAAGELVVVDDVDGDAAVGLLLDELLEALGGAGVVALIGAVAGEGELHGLAGGDVVAGGGVAVRSGLAAAGGQGEDHGEREDERKQLFHFRVSLSSCFFSSYFLHRHWMAFAWATMFSTVMPFLASRRS